MHHGLLYITISYAIQGTRLYDAFLVKRVVVWSIFLVKNYRILPSWSKVDDSICMWRVEPCQFFHERLHRGKGEEQRYFGNGLMRINLRPT